MKKTLISLKKSLAQLMIICMMITMLPAGTHAVTTSDISDHWAKNTIQSWLDQSLITGYEDGSFKPDKSITRAEFMALVNKVYNIQLKRE